MNKHPYHVEVDDHSDDFGTVYALRGPNVSILSKDEDELNYRADDFNLGFEMGLAALPAPASLDAPMIQKRKSEYLEKGDCACCQKEASEFHTLEFWKFNYEHRGDLGTAGGWLCVDCSKALKETVCDVQWMNALIKAGRTQPATMDMNKCNCRDGKTEDEIGHKPFCTKYEFPAAPMEEGKCQGCGFSLRNCEASKKAGCVSCCPDCSHPTSTEGKDA